MASFWFMSLLDLDKTISLPYKSFVSLRFTVLSRSFTVVFLFADLNILLFSFFTGAHRLTSPLIGSSAIKKQTHVIVKIKEEILKHGNPVAVVGDSLHNMITHAYIRDEYVQIILNADN